MIYQNMYLNIDAYWYSHTILGAMIYYENNDQVVTKDNKYVMNHSGNQIIHNTNILRKLLVQCKDDTDQWSPLNLIK